MIGTTLSHFRITAKLGEGGMGEVYRAEDTTLGREVAIKILPAAFTQDSERFARFEREAKVLASLNHPNIGAIYELAEDGGTRFLVLELAEGEDLAARLARGPIPLGEALSLALQITEALEVAHEKGIVHRDLKPANIMVSADGKVKVLDFGLAKAAAEVLPDSDTTQSPTLTAQMTQAGVIIGTAAYMSPEQARGLEADKRSDIWALGAVLMEMLSGRRVHGGETVSDVLASVLTREPDWESLPSATPPSMRALLARCLDKDVSVRLRDIGEARIAIDKSLAGEDPAEPLPGPSRSARLAWAIAGLAVIGLLALTWQLWETAEPPARPSSRLRIDVVPGAALPASLGPAVALSPDGSRLIYVARTGDSQQLYMRPIDQFQATAIQGTEGARDPFFSPAGDWIGFFTESALMKVAVSGGIPVTITPTNRSRGGAWGPNDVIVFTPHITAGLFQVSAAGGEASPLTTRGVGVRSHRWPQFLPDGRHVVYLSQRVGFNYDESDIAILNLESGESTMIHRGGERPRILPTGHLTFARQGTLFVAPFDLKRLEVTGPPVPAVERIFHHTGRGDAQYAVSTTGDLVYVEGQFVDLRISLLAVDRSGDFTAMGVDPKAYTGTAFSSDGAQLAVDIKSDTNDDIWVLDLERGVSSRLTFGPTRNIHPIWTRSGSHITFTSYDDEAPNIYWKRADGTGEPTRLVSLSGGSFPSSWSPDDTTLAFQQESPEADFDIWTMTMDERGRPSEPQAFLATSFDEKHPVISPNGKWLAYTSDESGRDEIYVRPFPEGIGKWQVSSNGGTFARWSSRQHELFYRNETELVSVAYFEEDDSFRAETPRVLFSLTTSTHPIHPSYDVHPDGEQFVMIGLAGDENPEVIETTRINLVFNWFDEVKRLISVQGE